jgi:hypothetical protein
VLNSEHLQVKRIKDFANEIPNKLTSDNEFKSSFLLKNLVDSHTRMNFFEVKYGFMFFPKTLSKYFRLRKDKIIPLFLTQFEKLLEEQEFLHFQKVKTTNEPFSFFHFLAKFCQMKVVEELLENSLEKMCFKSFRFLSEFVKIFKKQKTKEFEDKITFKKSQNNIISTQTKSLSNQLFDIMRFSFSINKKHNKFMQFILLPMYISSKFFT